MPEILKLLEEEEFNSVLNKTVSKDALYSECVTRVASADYETIAKRLHWTSPTEQKIETFIGLYIWVQHNFNVSYTNALSNNYSNRLTGLNNTLTGNKLTPYKLYIELHKVLHSAEYNQIILTIIRCWYSKGMSGGKVLATTIQLLRLCSECPSVFNGDIEVWKDVQPPLSYMSKFLEFTQEYITRTIKSYRSDVNLKWPR
jgi:hypothetical protein